MYDKAPTNGVGRRSEWFRRLSWWKCFAGYYPVTNIKTVELNPNKTYIFGYHPHGIISVGAFATFATEATGFSKNFPGIRPTLMTLKAQFFSPFWREYLLSLGMADVSRESCINSLSQGPGSSITIVLGGAEESLLSKPDTLDLVLMKRKGFVKIGLEQGSSLVPVLALGETDLWDQVPNPPGSKLRQIQDLLRSYISFTVPFIHGRGIFQYGFGLMPQRKPITVIFGSPIHLPKTTCPPNLDTTEKEDFNKKI